MQYYHVVLTPKSSNSSTEFRLDLTLEEIESQYLSRYRDGTPIVINGKVLRIAEVDRLRITRTEKNSDSLRPMAQAKQKASSLEYPSLIESDIAYSGEDVTNALMTSPPSTVFDVTTGESMTPQPPPDAREVFVVHGRNLAARDAVFEFLRAIDLHPVEWSQAILSTARPSPYIGEVLDAAFSRAHAVLVLLTPDDEARLRMAFRTAGDPPHEIELAGQARPNVLFEAGMAMGRDENRTVIVELGILRPFSDVAGRHVIRLDDSTQRRQELAHRLQAAGCPVNLDGTDWHTTGDFEAGLEQARSTEAQASTHDQV